MSGGLVPWEDVEAVGLGKLNSGTLTVVGIRLASYDAYLQSLPDQAKKESLAFGWLGSAVGALTIPANFDASSAAQAVAEGDLKGLVNWDLLSVPRRDLAKQLLWARKQTGGYDLSWTGMNFAGRPATVVATIEDYRRTRTQNS